MNITRLGVFIIIALATLCEAGKRSHTILEKAQGHFTSHQKSPLYPDIKDKRWEIVVNRGHIPHQSLNKTFLDQKWNGGTSNFWFDLDAEIFDVLVNNSLHSLGQWCGLDTPHPIKSSRHRLIVDFHSDNQTSYDREGFEASWISHSECGGNFSTDSGVLATPDYPNKIRGDHNCKWTIQVTSGQAIQLTFLEPFKLATCQPYDNYGNVFVYDILPNGKRFLRNFMCGSDLPPPLVSTGSTIEVYFNSSFDKSYHGFSAVWEKVGKPHTLLYGIKRRLKSPNFPSTYPDSVDKRWELVAPVDEFITLYFNDFNLGHDDHKTCDQDWIEISDVMANNSLFILGRWCGSDFPPFIVSSGFRLFIDFHSDNNSANNGVGFQAAWTADFECGGEFTTDNGLVTSPNYPESHGHQVFCQWDISVAQGYVIHLNFIEPFSMPKCHHAKCTFLKIFEVIPSGKKIITARHSGGILPLPWTSTTSTIRIFLRRNTGDTHPGFAAYWSKVKPSKTLRVIGRKGTIKTYIYRDTVDRRWEIIALAGQHVWLKFKHFRLAKGQSSSCDHDRLEIFDVLYNNTLISLGQWCGSDAPPPIKSSGQKLVLVFHKNGGQTNNRRGFLAKWKSEANCGGILTTDSGLWTSPYYPDHYIKEDCEWTIRVTKGHIIRLNFSAPYTGPCHRSCDCEFIRIYDIMSDGKRFERSAWCGQDLNLSMLSSTSSIVVRMIPKPYNGWKKIGFFFTWDKIAQNHTVLYASQNNLSSPNYPSSYPDNLSKRWEIIVPNGQYIKLQFNTFDLGRAGNNSNCSQDKIEIFEVLHNYSMLSLGQWCGSDIPPPIKSSSSKLFIDFHSDNDTSNNGGGFTANWRPDDSCGGYFTNDRGLILTPYGNSHPEKYFNCKWRINATEGYMTVFRLLTPLKECPDCAKYYPKVYDVLSNGERLENKQPWREGDSHSVPMKTSSPVTEIGIHGYTRWTKTKMAILWEKVENPNIVLYADERNFMSPKYPSTYPETFYQRWEIMVPRGQHVVLEFKAFDLGSGMENPGTSDRIEIFDELLNKTLFRLGQWCGSNTPPVVKSSMSRLFVDFYTDSNSSNNGQGFKASWSPESKCGGYMTTDRGVFASPNYPNYYSEREFCKWTLNVTQGYVIRVEFMHPFQLNHGSYSECSHAVIDVVDLLPDWDRLPRTYWCQRRGFPSPYYSSSSALELTFKVLTGSVGKGFAAIWSKVKPPHTMIAKRRGTLTSPGFPTTYPEHFNKRWEIIAPLGELLTLKFHHFNLGNGNGTSCGQERMEVYDVMHNESLRHLGQWCGSDVPPPIKTMQARLIVDFHTDENTTNDGKGFQASWFTDYKCGERLYLPSGNEGKISSERYPHDYLNNHFCHWAFIEWPPHAFKLTFLPPFGLEDCFNCECDSLKVFETFPNGTRYLRAVMCGDKVPPPLVATKSSLEMELSTNHNRTGSGINVKWSKELIPFYGRTLLQGMHGTFTTPNYPSSYKGAADSMWFIVVPFGQAISLEFNKFNLSDSCSQDYLQVFEEFCDDCGVMSLGKWCGTNSPPVIQSAKSKLFVNFHADDNDVNNGQGFQAAWRAVSPCGRVFTTDKGLLASPNYPYNLGPHEFCKWTINVTSGHLINVQFKSPFGLGECGDCNRCASIKAYNVMPNGERHLQGHWCGIKRPPNFKSTSSVLDLELQTHYQGAGNGFQISWMKVGQPV